MTSVTFINFVTLFCIQDARRFNVALGVVIVMACFWINASNSTNHFRRKQNVFDRNHLGQQVNAWLVIDTRVKVNVVEQMFLQ